MRSLLRQVQVYKDLMSKKQELALHAPDSVVSDRDLSKAVGLGVDIVKEQLSSGLEARDDLVAHNMRLVHSLARKLRPSNSPASHADLVQEGALGLLRAIDRFDVSVGRGDFVSFAYPWIRGSILKASGEQDLIKLPRLLRRAVSAVWKKNGMDDEQLAMEVGVGIETVRRARGIEQWWRVLGENSFVGSNEPRSRGYEEPVVLNVEAISPFLKTNELTALSLRFGFAPTRDYEAEVLAELESAHLLAPEQQLRRGPASDGYRTYVEVAERMSMSAENARLLVNRAISKLKKAVERGELSEFYI